MSYAPQSAGYFDTIQMFFLELTGRAVMFSGRDMELLCRWRDQGATAAIVCRGIEEAVRSMAEDEPPRGVRSCQGWIERELENARERGGGGHLKERSPQAEVYTYPQDEELQQDAAASKKNAASDAIKDEEAPPINPHEALLKGALARIEAAGQACKKDALRAAYRDAWRATRALLERDALRDPYGELASIEDALADGYFRALDLQKQQEIAEAIAAQDPGGLALMSPAAREEHIAARRRSFLVREHGLLRLLE